MDPTGEAIDDALLVCDAGPSEDDGGRCYATAHDPGLAVLEAEEWAGRTVRLRHHDGVNLAEA